MTVEHLLLRAPTAWLMGRMRAVSRRPSAALLLGTGLVAGALGLLIASPRTLRPSYHYAIGDFATAAVRAPWDLSVRDEDATARLRDETARHVPPVASLDLRPSTVLPTRIVEVCAHARELIGAADASRHVPESAAAALRATARRRLQQARALDADRAVQAAIQESITSVEGQLGVLLTPNERNMLATGRFDRRFDDGLLALLKEAYSRPIARDAQQLRNAASRSQRPGEPPRVNLHAGAPAPERVLPDAAMIDDLPGAIGRMRARAAYLLPASSPFERDLLVGIASRLVTPDTAYDEAATAEHRMKAAADVLPISLNFRRNQLIVGEGREVTREALLVLALLRQQGLPRAFLGRAAGATAVIWVLLAALVWLPHQVGLSRVSLRDAAFFLAAVITATAAFWIWLMLADGVSVRAPGMPRITLLLLFPATAAPMLAGLVTTRRLAVGLVAAVAVTTGLLTDLGILFAAYTLAVGLVSVQLVSQCGQRSCVLRAGLRSGAAAAASSLGVLALAGPDGGAAAALAAVAGAFLGAAGGGLVALSFSRPVEWAFGYATRLRLVELLSYDHPLLRRLMERAPGTFQHSVAVALLARKAAEAISADALLVRVGALYHDVGKLESPEYFTENQRGENPHDRMAPGDSARVILDHVTRGVRLLEEHRVGGRIADFAREHQGTGALTFFQQKAEAEAEGRSVDPAAFRYGGPRPQSRETAVLMMADKIEATARSRGTATSEAFRSVVDQTIADLQAAGELAESPLTLRDLTALHRAFASALIDLHHTRVAYPTPAQPASSAPVTPVSAD